MAIDPQRQESEKQEREALKANPERDGRAGMKPAWEDVKEAELKRQALERQNQLDAQKQALADMLKAAQTAGKDKAEIDERRKAFEEIHKRQQETLARGQQERLDRQELLYRGAPSGRERA